MSDHTISAFTKGTENLLNPEVISTDAAQDSQGWLTKDGRIVLAGGRNLIGNDSNTAGPVCGVFFGYKTDGTKVMYKKGKTNIRYFNGTTWVIIISGLTAGADYTFSNYSSLAGAFTFIIGPDGIWKIVNAYPMNPINMTSYSATTGLPIKNFKGKAFIDRGRMILWGRLQDKTSLYGSHIDPQDGTVYNTIAGEVLGSFGSVTYSGNLRMNYTVTITEASPAVVTLSPNNFLGGEEVVFNILTGTVGALPGGITAGKTYYVSKTGLSSSAFQIQDELGNQINTTSAGSGTFVMSNPNINAFGISISGTVASGVEIFSDNYTGGLTSQNGGTGTINYVTGAYSVTFSSAVASGNVTAQYQWEDSNNRGVTDFTSAVPRLAGQGFIFPQDDGGDAILNVLIGQDGSYFSMKSQSFYQLILDSTDLNASNSVYRKDLGIPAFRAGVSTNKGVVFINMANPVKPEMTRLEKSLVTNNIEPTILFPGFKFANYTYTDCCMDTWDRYIVVFCMSLASSSNDTVLLCDPVQGTVDAVSYAGRCTAKDGDGNLYVGHPLVENIYQLFNGFDDMGLPITNYWISKADQYQMATGFSRALRYQIGERLKKYRRQKIKGVMAASQKLGIYIDCDGSGFQLVGTILGTGSYVDYTSPQAIGSNPIGQSQFGGDESHVQGYNYFTEVKVKLPKFRNRTIKLVALGIGYIDVQMLSDFDILVFEMRLPTRFRQKQNVSLDGTTSDIPES